MERADSQHPWSGYSRARLPAGLTHVLGRDAIEAGLVHADARIRTLSLGRPDLPVRGHVHTAFDVFFSGDAHPRSVKTATRSDLLLMRWTALPSALATSVRTDVARTWLDRGCAWAADALVAGNTWAAAEHRRALLVDHGELRAVHT